MSALLCAIVFLDSRRIIIVISLVNAMLTDEEEWQAFKIQHNKTYQSPDEETRRFNIFKDNLEKIREHNEKYERGEASFKMGVNKFADLTNEEFKATYGRGILKPKDEEYNPYLA